MIVVEIVDPRDQEIPAVGPVVLRTPRPGETALVERPAPRPAGTPSSGEREREELSRLTRQLGVDHLELRTDRPYINTLLAFFEQRRRGCGG